MTNEILLVLLIAVIILNASVDEFDAGFSWTPKRSNHGPINFLPTLAFFYDQEFKFDDTILEIAWLFFYVNLIWRRKPITADAHQHHADDFEPMDGGVLMILCTQSPPGLFVLEPSEPRCGFPISAPSVVNTGSELIAYCMKPATPGCAYCDEHAQNSKDVIGLRLDAGVIRGKKDKSAKTQS